MERELRFLQMLAESVCSHLVPTILGESVGVHRLTGCQHHSVTLSLFHGRTLRSCVRVTDHGTRLRQRSRIESLVVQLGRLVHKATGVHHGALSFAHVLWVCAPPQGVVDDSSDAVQLDDLRLVDFTQATQNKQIPCVPGLCSCYPEHFMVDAWTLGESKDHQTLEAMADAFASGPAPALPRDMLMEAAPGGVAQEMFLAGVKNNGGPDCAGSIQDAVRDNKYDWQGVCHALRHAPASKTDPPTYSTGPTAFLKSQLQLLTDPPIPNWNMDPGEGGRFLPLYGDAEAKFDKFNNEFENIGDGELGTTPELYHRMRELCEALCRVCPGISETSQYGYRATRIARASLTIHPSPTDSGGCTLEQLREVSPDEGGYLSEAMCNDRDVSQIVWPIGCAPEHYSMWCCLWHSDWGKQQYFPSHA